MEDNSALKRIVPFVVMAIIVLPTALYLKHTWEKHREAAFREAAWQRAKADGSLQGYSWFLGTYGEGLFADSARQQFDLLFEKEATGLPATELGNTLRSLARYHRTVVLSVTFGTSTSAPRDSTGRNWPLQADWEQALRGISGIPSLMLLESPADSSGLMLRIIARDDLPKEWVRLDPQEAVSGCANYQAIARADALKGHRAVRGIALLSGDSVVWSDSLAWDMCSIGSCDSTALDACGLAQRSLRLDSLQLAGAQPTPELDSVE